MRGGLATLALGLMLVGVAQAAPPESSPRPQPRPVLAVEVATAALVASPRPLPRPETVGRAMTPDPALPAAALAEVLRPRPRPALTPEPAVVAAPRNPIILPHLAGKPPPPRPENLGEVVTVAATIFPTKPLASIITGRKGSVCGDRSIKGRTIPPIAAKLKGCGLQDGVEITSVAGVAMSAPVVTDCATATSLRDWVEGAVIPAVGRKGGGVEQLQVAASYVCRPRNNQKGNKISEHGKGHAVDISAIVLADGSAISVERDWGKGKAGKILKAVRVAACGPFTTVLGPGSDRFHRDHLHLDTARGRGAWCR